MFLKGFLGALFLCLAIILALQAPARVSPFDERRVSVNLDVLPRQDIAGLKIAHALGTDTYDIGVFGNSRSISLTGKHLKVGARTFFNFSVPGTSLRQTVALIQRLALDKRVPRITIVSVDNMSLQYYANPIYPTPPIRWYSAIDDINFGWQSKEVSVEDLLRMLKRHLLIEWKLLSEFFNMQILLSRRGYNIDIDHDVTLYSADGSRLQSIAEGPRKSRKIRASRKNIIPAYLSRDLFLLSQAINSDRYLIVETPLENGFIDTSPEATKRIRSYFRQQCKLLHLRCVGPEYSENGLTDWPDVSHPPVKWYGEQLSQKLAPFLRTKE